MYDERFPKISALTLYLFDVAVFTNSKGINLEYSNVRVGHHATSIDADIHNFELDSERYTSISDRV